MNKKKVITIDPNGVVSVEAFGYADKTCKEATKPLTDALLGDAGKDFLKPEFYRSQVVIYENGLKTQV
jgi:hypothetical protein